MMAALRRVRREILIILSRGHSVHTLTNIDRGFAKPQNWTCIRIAPAQAEARELYLVPLSHSLALDSCEKQSNYLHIHSVLSISECSLNFASVVQLEKFEFSLFMLCGHAQHRIFLNPYLFTHLPWFVSHI